VGVNMLGYVCEGDDLLLVILVGICVIKGVNKSIRVVV
jgi:hypothetical protein